MSSIGEGCNRLEVPCSLQGIAEVEPLLEQIVAQYISDSSRIYFVSLSVIEILNNVVEHGYNAMPPPNARIDLNFTPSPTGLRIELIDKATTLPDATIEHLTSGRSSMPSPHQEIDALPLSGWGLNIITSTASSISYQRHCDHNLMTLEFDTGSSYAVNSSTR